MLDGQRLSLGEGKHDGDFRLSRAYERVTFSVTRADIEALAAANAIEIQFRRYEGSIEKDGQPRIKTLLDLATKK